MKEKLYGYLSFFKNHYYQRKIRKFISKTNFHFEKLGTRYGAGIIPKNFLNSQSVCYCAGAGEDISFDLELTKKFHCNVYIFDPTPRAKKHYDELILRINNGEMMPIDNYSQSQYYSIKPEELKSCFFFPVGLWSEDKTLKFFPPENSEHISHSLVNLQKTVDYIEVECKKVSTIMSLLGHQKITLLKLDIVGAEYEVIDSLIKDKIYPDLLLIEFDEGALAAMNQDHCLDQKYFMRITNSINKLKKAGYILAFLDDWNATFIRESTLPNQQED
jgi:FkbM family methyltransferase